MTIEDIEARNKEFLSAEDIAPYLECNPQTLRSQAQDQHETLGFPAVVVGARVKLPKASFVFFHRYGKPTSGR